MARLHVQAAVRWAGGTTDFRFVPMLVAASVSNDVGAPVPGLPASAFHVRYQLEPASASTAAISDFHEHSAPQSGAGEYSFIVNPGGETAEQPWLQDEVFLYVTVRNASNHGQTLCLARYHHFQAP